MLAYAAMPSSRSGLLACPASPVCTSSASHASVPRSTTSDAARRQDRPADDQRDCGRRRGLRKITSRTAIDDERVSLGLECGTPWCATAAPMASRPSAAVHRCRPYRDRGPPREALQGGRRDRALAYRRRPRGAGHPDGHRGQRQGGLADCPAAARPEGKGGKGAADAHSGGRWRPGTSSLPPGGLVVTLTRISAGARPRPTTTCQRARARRGRHHDGTGLPAPTGTRH